MPPRKKDQPEQLDVTAAVPSDAPPVGDGPEIAVGIMEKKLDTHDHTVPQPETIRTPVVDLGDDDGWVRPIESLPRQSDEVMMEYAEEIAFNEEPVVIFIHPNMMVKRPEQFVQVYVNGVGAEMYNYQTGQWQQVGVLPVGQNVTTRRKYVEAIANARNEVVATETYIKANGDEFNDIHKHQVVRHGFQIVKDWNKKHGPKWFHRVMQRPG